MSDEKKKIQVEHVQSEKFQSIYTNNANVQISYFDFRIDFRQMLTGTDGRMIVERQASVVMSPQHAKALLGVLAQHVEQYEEQFGAIRMPGGTAH
ncbi:MAG TPA: DUF3467 domain-containing protein [Syntrophobacter fumaroxidans]|nr:DUF3467 domain-containing protein [Syntrophobacter fumaroxidans]